MAFNIRVYGLLIHQGHVLVSDEQRFGKQFTKFPGGGLDLGEGTHDCLIREFQEELNLSIQVGDLFYLTDFFQKSAFNDKDQLITIYYFVTTKDCSQIKTVSNRFDFQENSQEVHRWVELAAIESEDFEFPIDKLVVEKLQAL